MGRLAAELIHRTGSGEKRQVLMLRPDIAPRQGPAFRPKKAVRYRVSTFSRASPTALPLQDGKEWWIRRFGDCRDPPQLPGSDERFGGPVASANHEQASRCDRLRVQG